jgi:hypothetical protein
MVSEELIFGQYTEAIQKFPKLHQPEKIGEVWIIKGDIDVIDDEGGYWGTFEVKIVVPENFPEELFELHETGNRIPKEANWHNSNFCCLSTNAIMFTKMLGNLTLVNWLEKFAHPFLANFMVKVNTGKYENGEFDHGPKGIAQGYFKIFNTNDLSEVTERLQLITKKKKLSQNQQCFCGSGKKYKRCFLLNPEKHHLGIPISILKKDLAEITRLGLQ